MLFDNLRSDIRYGVKQLCKSPAFTVAATALSLWMLYGVSPSDLPTILGVSAILATVALAASLVPALRATRIDPIQAIRHT